MNRYLVLIAFTIVGSFSYAADDCTKEIGQFFSKLAPQSGKVTISGHYSEMAESGRYNQCSLSMSLYNQLINIEFTPENFNPGLGDKNGGAFWPFGTYPTAKPSERNRTVISYGCDVDEDGFEIDYTYRDSGNWDSRQRYHVSLVKNYDGSYSASLVTGETISKPTTCVGTVGE